MSRFNASFRLTTLALACALTSGTAFAVPGDPDRNFGPDGVRYLQNGGVGDIARAVEPAGNGAAYVAGQYDPANPNGQVYQMGVAKITALGELRWRTKLGKLSSEPMRPLRPVRELLNAPEPDTSWMREPIPRAKFCGWLTE